MPKTSSRVGVRRVSFKPIGIVLSIFAGLRVGEIAALKQQALRVGPTVAVRRMRPEGEGAHSARPPGRAKFVDTEMYEAMKRAFLKILPKTAPGLPEDLLAEGRSEPARA
jgi:hypothetical protein